MHYLITCKSLTYAQRSSDVLNRKGISAILVKVPQKLSSSGCSYGLKIKQRDHSTAVRILNDVGLSPLRMFLVQGTEYTEVPM